jgi:hypothetical protein
VVSGAGEHGDGRHCQDGGDGPFDDRGFEHGFFSLETGARATPLGVIHLSDGGCAGDEENYLAVREGTRGASFDKLRTGRTRR